LRSAFHSFEAHWSASILERLSGETQHALDDLLVTNASDGETDVDAPEHRRSILNELTADAGAISLESVLAEIAKLERLRAVGLPPDLFGDVSLKVVERFGNGPRRQPQTSCARTRRLWAPPWSHRCAGSANAR
jgi:hypothetical protein